MPCYHPLKAKYVLTTDPETGRSKKDLRFEGNKGYHWYLPDIEIPCGQCIGCRLEYSRQWAIRIMLEAKQYEFNWFITLTYDNDHLPEIRESVDCDENGEITNYYMMNTLVPRDLELFMKRFRQLVKRKFNWNEPVRFYACGEYGDESSRPHYHLCIFNCPFPDLRKSKCKAHTDNLLFESELLDEAWQHRGLAVIGELTFESAAYTARYMMKKRKGKDADWYEKRNVEPEFVRMSRRPGIGYNYYSSRSDRIYDLDSIYLGRPGKVPLECRPPSYYDRLYDVDHHEELMALKERRKAAALREQELLTVKTDLDPEEYLYNTEVSKKKQIRSLKRKT